MSIELSPEERTLLVEILDESLRNLKEEIYHTDSFDYKEALKARESLLLGLLERLRSGETTTPT